MRRTLSPLFFSFALAATAVLASSCFTDSCACVTVPPARQDRWIRLTPLRDSLDLTLDPGLLLARTIGAIDAIDAVRPDDARALVTALNATGPWLGQVAYSLGMAGDTVAARATIRDLERMPPDTWLLHTALAYANFGARDTSHALTELERALAAREITPDWSSFSDRMFDPLRQSARFAAVVRGFGLDQRIMTSPNGGRPAK